MNDEMNKAAENCNCDCKNCSNCGPDGKVCGGHCGCNCIHHKVAPVAVALIGLTFLLQAFNVVAPETVAVIWPILLIVAAGTKAAKGMCKCC